jgi:hypothetical protein
MLLRGRRAREERMEPRRSGTLAVATWVAATLMLVTSIPPAEAGSAVPAT